MSIPLAVELVEFEAVLPLRRRILFPGRQPEDAQLPGDKDTRSAHAAAFLEGTAFVEGAVRLPLAVASVIPEAPGWDESRTDGWRIRGLATEPQMRGRGVAGMLVKALINYVSYAGGGCIWSGTGIEAVTLFDRQGFSRLGPPFEIPGAGHHQTVWKFVQGASASAVGVELDA